VDIMRTVPTVDLTTVALGDLVRLPDGRVFSARAVMPRLPASVGPMAGFVLLGELGPDAVLASVPSVVAGQVLLYSALNKVPASARSAVEVTAGVVTYWPPHVPALAGAMSALAFKVCKLPARSEPLVLVWRDKELVVFVHTGSAAFHDMTVEALDRDPSVTDIPVVRAAAAVVTPDRGDVELDSATIGIYERVTASR